LGGEGTVRVAYDLVEERLVAAVCASLEPYEWRNFTPQMLARYVLGVVDHLRVLDLVGDVPGVAVGDPWPVRPVEPGDVRVEVLVDFLILHRWRTLTLAALIRHLFNELGGWCRRRRWVDAELGRLLDDEQ
jgi:hypothetical protein